MAPNNNRYKEMERYMTYALLADLLFFILYLCCAGIIWLKVIFSILVIVLSGSSLFYLYVTKELLKQRSLWMSAAAASMLVCLLFSLLVNFP